jgi:hypothetical protein
VAQAGSPRLPALTERSPRTPHRTPACSFRARPPVRSAASPPATRIPPAARIAAPAAQSCPHLQSLDLGGCKKLITDAGLRTIAEHCAALRSINLRFCESITDEGVLAVQEACVNVQVRR